jgi:hypothetical protein
MPRGAMADWGTISSLATAGGTLVLGVATFAAVRTSNRSARIAETALQEQRRPVLVHARLDDPVQKIRFGDGRWVRTEGNRAVVEEGEEQAHIYLAIPLRNVGSGIAVLQGWHIAPDVTSINSPHPPLEDFHEQMRDFFIPPGDVGLWQGRLRDREAADHGRVRAARGGQEVFAVDLLYSDQVGEQRSISRFTITPIPEDNWLADVVRHWPVERSGPRDS